MEAGSMKKHIRMLSLLEDNSMENETAGICSEVSSDFWTMQPTEQSIETFVYVMGNTLELNAAFLCIDLFRWNIRIIGLEQRLKSLALTKCYNEFSIKRRKISYKNSQYLKKKVCGQLKKQQLNTIHGGWAHVRLYEITTREWKWKQS